MSQEDVPGTSRPRVPQQSTGAHEADPPTGDAASIDPRAGSALLQGLEERYRTIAGRATAALGFGQTSRQMGAGRESLWSSRVLLPLTVFVGLDEAFTVMLSLLGPGITRSLGISTSTYNLIATGKTQATLTVGLILAWQIQRGKTSRVSAAGQAAIGLSLAFLLSSIVTNAWWLQATLGLAGVSSGALYASHRPLLMDNFEPSARVRAFSLYEYGAIAGAIVAPVLFWTISGPAGLTWRGVLAVVGVLFGIICLVGLRLREPGYGTFDTERVRALVRSEDSAISGTPSDEPLSVSLFEIIRRVWMIRTVRTLLWAWALLGAMLYPLVTYVFLYFQDRWLLTLDQRAALFAVAWVPAIGVMTWFIRRGDRTSAADPGYLLRFGARSCLVLAAAAIVVAAVPVLPVAVIALTIVFAITALLVPALTVPMLSVVEPRMRPHVGALVGVFLVGVGGGGGSFILTGVNDSFGPAVTIGFFALPAVLAAIALGRVRRGLAADVEGLAAEVSQREQVRILTGRGSHLPMLVCRHIDFAYGSMQVLFNVGFAVDEGEMVSLLGTNGAGKSTLLRVILGLGIPSRGAVTFRGGDVTFFDSHRRVPLGIAGVPGGRAVFGPLTVAENLRVFGYSRGRQRRSVENGLEQAFEVFPQLRDKRSQLAATLSGGEQQMLGLARAFVAPPRLLLVDELSLGLAPKIVGQLLDVVQRINASGTAVVLVEQSISVALSITRHAYFMEKGEIRFDGPSADLAGRSDLLRSVFLKGAAGGVEAMGQGGAR
jgi:ABC-type branched-subunit amino acid transport system ATPase component/MFS family permease